MHVAAAEWAWRAEKPTLLMDFYRGIRSYRRHPYRRDVGDHPIVWESGRCQLVDYGPSHAWPLLVVPSLVNRAYILDLMPGMSLLAYLSANGLRPMLLDWGEGRTADREFGLDGLIVDRMEPALTWIRRLTGKPPLVLGYCMGGTLATALACRRHEQMSGLALLATPWNFDHDGNSSGQRSSLFSATVDCAGHIGSTPVDSLQAFFAHIEPLNVPRKFARFARIAPTSDAAIRFVAIEDWLNDGVPLTAEITSECLVGWFDGNEPARGAWRIGGAPIRPENMHLPVCLAIPERDRIVPPASALALADSLPNCSLIRPSAGHIGMVAGRDARTSLWVPLLRWLQDIAAMQKNPW